MELTAYTWNALATVGGAAAATLVIVQYLKLPLDRFHHVPTRLLVWIVSLAVLVIAQALTAGLTWQDALLALVNSFVVALAAMGAYEITFANTDPPAAATTKPAA